jgi:hypothetical protein
VNEWFKAYLTLIGFPLTVLAAVLKIGEGTATTTLSTLPDFVSVLLIIVSMLGLFVTFSIISMRMEMILYARTINRVRGFFAEADSGLIPYLVLPIKDAKPPFYEAWRAMFWQVLMIGFMDGIIMGGGIMSLSKNGIFVGVIAGVLFWFFHWLVYWWMSQKRENEWKKPKQDPDDTVVSHV